MYSLFKKISEKTRTQKSAELMKHVRATSQYQTLQVCAHHIHFQHGDFAIVSVYPDIADCFTIQFYMLHLLWELEIVSSDSRIL